MNAKSAVCDTGSQGNAVDALQAQIRQIQGACQHQYKIFPGSFSLGKSKVEEVLIGSIMGAQIIISMRCDRCSSVKREFVTDVCPHCAGKMIEGDIHERAKYFTDGEYLYYGARLYTCESCHRTVAVDEWDQ
ncbi:MAG: hypothetical protein Q8L52_00060 [bacterium]|nr:hypothetical protein [bacterium]